MEGCYDIGDWSGDFLKLTRNTSFICPTTTSREHDNIGAFVPLIQKLGMFILVVIVKKVNLF